MYQWYRLPIDYDDNGSRQPKYADEEIHEKLQEQDDVIVLAEEEVVNILNSYFNRSYTFDDWNDRFKIS